MKSKKKEYGDIKFHHPDGTLMFIHNRHKVDQYLKKDLVAITEQEIDPKTGLDVIKAVKFKFDPHGNGPQHPYYLIAIKNICVVCGDDNFENLTRHHVFPDCYKEELPEKIKANNHYDIFRICVKHHDEYEIHAQLLKKQIAKELQVTTPDGKNIEADAVKFKRKLSGMAFRILSKDSSIPQKRVDAIYSSISEFTGIPIENITNEYLKELAEERNKTYVTDRKHLHGYQVMQKITDLQEFVERWRNHFIEYANPQFLPELWNVKEKVYKDE